MRAAARVRRERDEQEQRERAATPAPEPTPPLPPPPEPVPEPVKKIVLSPETIREVFSKIYAEFPTLRPCAETQRLIGKFMVENNLTDEFNLETVRKVVQILSYPQDQFARIRPPAPVAPAPVMPAEPEEILQEGQLSLKADQWQLRNATPARLKDFLKRANAANAKK
jgi:hypothetical protein